MKGTFRPRNGYIIGLRVFGLTLRPKTQDIVTSATLILEILFESSPHG